jgi:hypothetical protein
MHATHVLLELGEHAVLLRLDPAGQDNVHGVQAAPLVSLYLPAAHSAHWGLDWGEQGPTSSCCGGHDAVQGWHVGDAGSVLNVPAGHPWHCGLAVGVQLPVTWSPVPHPVVHAAHVSGGMVAKRYAPDAHAVHVLSVLGVHVGRRYCPAAQVLTHGAHADVLPSALNVPVPHGVHVTPLPSKPGAAH